MISAYLIVDLLVLLVSLAVLWVLIWVCLGIFVVMVIRRHGNRTQKTMMELVKAHGSLSPEALEIVLPKYAAKAALDRQFFLRHCESFVFEIFDIAGFRYRLRVVTGSGRVYSWVSKFGKLTKILAFLLERVPGASSWKEVRWTDLDLDRKMSYIKGNGSILRRDKDESES